MHERPVSILVPRENPASRQQPSIFGIDPHPSCAQERPGLAFRHLDRAVGCDVEKEHIAMADALRNAQTHPALALGLPSAKLFGAPPVSSKIPRLEVGPPAPSMSSAAITTCCRSAPMPELP